MAGLHRARQGRAGLGRRRQRVHRLPQRVRRHVRRPREPGDRRRRSSAQRASAAPTSPRRPRARSRVAEELRRRFGLPQWRFTNSGTESTMDAVHLARGATGRDMILKIEGSYHGHHDAVMVSVYPPLEELGERDDPRSVPYGAGYPQRDHRADPRGPVQRRAARWSGCWTSSRARSPALIMEPAMMNINIVPPVEGYLERVRELTAAARREADLRRGEDRRDDLARRRDAALRRAARHDHAREGDLRRPARRRDRDDRGAGARVVADGTVHQYGTFNGNPLVMAAAEATLTEVLTDAAYEQLERTNDRAPATGCDEIIERYGLPCYTEGMGAKGCVVFSVRAAARVPRLPDEGRRRPVDAGLALPHEPRHLHDARASRRSGRCRSRTPTSTCERYLDAFEASPAT